MSVANVVSLVPPVENDPLIGDEVDVHDFEFMPLELTRLARSKSWLAAKRNPELGFYMVNLWGRAWQEVPAGSIEDDDDVLADAAMCDPHRWLAVKGEVMRSWVFVASKNRWYNPTVCEKAKKAWDERVKFRARSAAGHAARWGKGKNASSMPQACEGRGREKEIEDSSLRDA